jgi:hypothetical protein
MPPPLDTGQDADPSNPNPGEMPDQQPCGRDARRKEREAMPWKMDNDDHIVMQDGNPVFVHPDEKETAFDAEKSLAKIVELNSEAASRRRELREVEEKFKPFGEIEDPTEWLESAHTALETVKNFDDKKLIDAGEVERVKNEVTKVMQEKLEEVKEKLDAKDATLQREMIGGRFARSKYITEKLAIPQDMVESRFGGNFKIEDGVVVAYDHVGNKIYSREDPVDPAGFDEALEILVDNYPHKDYILKATDAKGSGAPHGDGRPTGVKSREDLKTPKDKADFIGKHGLQAFKDLPE